MKYLDYKENQQQGTFDFPIAFYHLEEGNAQYQMPYHWHPEYEIIRILEGSLGLVLDGKLFSAEKGDILFLSDGVLHGGVPQNCVYECIVFDMNLLMKNNHICGKQIQSIMRHETVIHRYLPDSIPGLREIVNTLFSAMNDQPAGYEFTTQGALYELLGIILRERLYETGSGTADLSARRLMQFKNVLSYIEIHYPEAISLNALAKIAEMSPKYFCRFFRKMTGRTPIDYINYYRTECACSQLSENSSSITDVALNCGFNDISYFIKTFHKYKGITPKQFQSTKS